MNRETTRRGFAVYARVPTRNGGTVRVQESSLAGEGAHVWLFLDGEKCTDHPPTGDHLAPSPHLGVTGAKALVAALQEFIREAEAGGR